MKCVWKEVDFFLLCTFCFAKLIKRAYQRVYVDQRGFIIFYLMELEQLSKTLSSLNLDLDPKLLQQIVNFINSLPIPKQTPESARLYIIAAASIKSEVNKIKAVGSDMHVKTGPPIEVFFRYMKAHQKQPFLEHLKKIARLSDQVPKYVGGKINEIERTYNVYLKYRSAFYALSSKANLDKDVTYDLMAIFWIAYLKIKPNYITLDGLSDNQRIEKELLFAQLRYFFHNIEKINQEQINHTFIEFFNDSINLTQQKYSTYTNQCLTILNEAYRIRYEETQKLDWVSLIKDQIKLQRFADDFSVHYSRQIDYYSETKINQLTYLQMNKRKAPLGIHKKITKIAFQPFVIDQRPQGVVVPIIFSPINFNINGRFVFSDQEDDAEESYDEDEDNEDEEDLNKVDDEVAFKSPIKICEKTARDRVSQRQYEMLKTLVRQVQEQLKEDKNRRNKFIIDKDQTRMSILKWIQDQIKTIQQFPRYIKRLMSNEDYEIKSLKIIIKILECVCPNCTDKFTRAKSIYSLFLSFLCKMKLNLQQQEFKQIISNDQSLNSFLCATTVIFTHVYKTEQMCFKYYCQRFDISVINGYIPLNWIGMNAQLPKELQLFVFQLEQRILFEDIWSTSCAFQLFSKNQDHTYNQMVIIKRIFKHINHRINQICNIQGADKDRINLYKFIEELLQKRIELLRYNNLYIILITSIIHCYGKAVSFDKIIQCLRKNQKYVKINLSFRDGLGGEIQFSKYYENYYLKQIQHLFNTPRQQFSTPIKTPKTTVRFASGIKTASSQKYIFGVDSLSLKIEKQGDSNYRKSLVDIILTGSPPQKKSQSEDQGDDLDP